MKKILKFSEDYSKLSNDQFTTIRRYDRYELNKEILVKTPTTRFKAVIYAKEKRKLIDIPTKFLLNDTDRKTRQEAIELLNSFYKTKIQSNEKLTICYLKKNLKTKKVEQ